VSRYDGQQFQTLTTQEDLADSWVGSIFQDREGDLWFGTWGGVSRYDGQQFQTLFQKDGLSANDVGSILQDQAGDLWFGTGKGVTRFRPPPPSPPPVFIDAVVAGRRYEEVEEVVVPSTINLVVFEFHGISFKTRPEAMVYRYRLKGYEEDWQSTHERRVEYQDLPIGDYTFEVLAVDRDLTYSEQPATVSLTVHPPYGTIALASGLGLALMVAGVVSGYAVRKRRAQRQAERALLSEQQARLQAQEQLNRELEEELQTAHQMQMGLMPKAAPQIAGLDIAGRCLPANHVGGDLFQYFLQDHTLSLCLADVTGHAMEAAVPVMMFSGILESEIHHRTTLEALFSRLNHTLHRKLDHRTFICFALGEIDTSTHTLRLANSACPYPYHFQAAEGQIAELGVEGYPLGIRPDSTYATLERSLEKGDYVVFCSDGIAEAPNGAGELFGFERAAEVILQGCREGLSAEALVERILSAVKAFAGGTPQADDQTVVVVKVKERSAQP
jgi:serine phosphatase RsbU (regulator of sigma subunit)